MAETAIYLALKKIGIAQGREENNVLGHEQGERSTREAGSIVFNVFENILSVAVSEEPLVTTQAALHGRMRRIESELRMIHCFLAQMETRYDNKQVLQSWIGEARKLGCRVEQTMDEYIFCILPKKGGSVRKKLLHVPTFARASHRLVAQLKEIEVELEHLSKMKKRWVQVDSQNSLPVFSTQPYASNNELTCGARREELIKLLDKGGQDLSVIAVCGQRGSGKTHLVRDVYQSLRKDFHFAAWISLSQYASTNDAVLKRTIQELQMDDSVTESATVKDCIQSLMEVLKEKKFLLVFDDVQVPDAAREVRQISFNNKMSSRIIIITRMPGVASGKYCSVAAESHTPSSSSEPPSMKLPDIQDLECMELTCLRSDEAFSLFCTKAFGSSNCPAQLRETSDDIIKLCDRLPQAIVSIGASLYIKQKTQSVWKEMIDQINRIRSSNSSLNDIHKILYVSYNNLPMHLKNCLLYCSIFPPGHLLLPARLIRLLVAEGFIEKQVSCQPEEIAYNYIEELIRWGFLQVMEVDEFGKVASCRMPVVVHELAVSISQKEVFGASCHGVKIEEMDTDVRCLFISKYDEDIVSLIDFPYLRTIIAHEDAASCLASIPASLSSKDKYLTVLELQGSQLKELPYNIGYLFNLRYLGLRNTEISRLPGSMKRLYNLQSLDLKRSRIQELPSWIGNLTRLRHIFADNLIDKSQTEFPSFGSVRVPRSVKHLKELQTLETVQTSTSFENNVHHLTQLSSLCVDKVEGRSCKTLFASLSMIPSLSSLEVSACSGNEELRFQTLTSDHLKRLIVRGRLFNKTFDYCPIFMSKTLQSLELSWCILWEDSLEQLSKNLCELVSLSLHRVSGIRHLLFQKDSFAKLRRLVLREIDEVTELKILDGSLGSLEFLRVESLDSIHQLENIQDLNKILSVRDLYFPKLISLQSGTDDI